MGGLWQTGTHLVLMVMLPVVAPQPFEMLPALGLQLLNPSSKPLLHLLIILLVLGL